MFSFFRPRWQHKDEAIRLAAVQEMSSDDQNIVKIARSDSSNAVRMAAIKKITDITTLSTISKSDHVQEVREFASNQMSLLWSGEHENSPDTQTILQWLNDNKTYNAPLAEIVINAKDDILRNTTFKKITDINDFFKIASHVNQCQVAAIEKINDELLLSKLVKVLPNNNKKIIKLVKDKLNELKTHNAQLENKQRLIEAYIYLADSESLAPLNQFSQLDKEWSNADLGDDVSRNAARERYLERYQTIQKLNIEQNNLVKSLEVLLNNPNQNELDTLMQSYEQLPKQALDKTLHEKWSKLYQQIEKAIVERNAQNVLDQKLEQVIIQIEKFLEQPFILNSQECKKFIKQLEDSHSNNNQLLAKKNNIKNQLNQRLEQALEAKEIIRFDEENYLKSLEKIATAIEQGALKEAKQIYNEAESLLKSALLPELMYKKHEQALRQYLPTIKEFNQWQSFATHHSLEALCENIEALAQNLELPTAVLQSRLNDLRALWKTTSQDSKQNSRHLWTRFNKSSQKIFDVIQSERKKTRTQRLDFYKEAQSLLTQLQQFIENIDWTHANWQQLSQVRNEWLHNWNQYLHQTSDGSVLEYGEPLFLAKEKRLLESELQKIMMPLTIALQNKRLAEFKRREATITELEHLLASDIPLNELIGFVKKAQSEWLPILKMRRKQEDELWQKFRNLCDQVFAKRQSEQHAQNEERQQNLILKQNIANELSNNIELSTDSENIESLLAAAQNAWDEIGSIPKENYDALEKQWKQLRSFAHKKQDDLYQALLTKNNQTLLNLGAQLTRYETQVLQSPDSIVNIDLSVSSFDFSGLTNVDKDLLNKRLNCLIKIKEEQAEGKTTALEFLRQQAKKADDIKRELCILKEILLGKESPESDQELRINLQINRLHDSLANKENNHITAFSLAKRWATQWAANHELELQKRFEHLN